MANIQTQQNRIYSGRERERERVCQTAAANCYQPQVGGINQRWWRWWRGPSGDGGARGGANLMVEEDKRRRRLRSVVAEASPHTDAAVTTRQTVQFPGAAMVWRQSRRWQRGPDCGGDGCRGTDMDSMASKKLREKLVA
jgi:hypothetical protein